MYMHMVFYAKIEKRDVISVPVVAVETSLIFSLFRVFKSNCNAQNLYHAKLVRVINVRFLA